MERETCDWGLKFFPLNCCQSEFSGFCILASAEACHLFNAIFLNLQIGKTKVFLRAGQMAELDARRAEVLSNAAKTIQRRILTYTARKQFLALREASICLQSSCRGEL